MKKSHFAYLHRIIGKAIADLNRESLTESVLRIKSPSSGIYQMMRDIVCDVRFYSVMDNDSFWKTYGAYKVGLFVDSLRTEEWEEVETLTMRKEDFLNEWMAIHILPLSLERRRNIEADIRLHMLTEEDAGMPDPDDHDGNALGIINLGNGIKDTTNHTGETAEGLPPRLKEYMDDAAGGNSPGLESDPHQADALFLADIHPSIVRLANKIGRKTGESTEQKGKFHRAPKSDISGVSLGNDLSSLLPSEIALMATPESEKIFLDRFARKRLQIFSSASRSTESVKKRKGPILICVDTSGSMVGKPEEMAKTLALAICIVAQKENRAVIIFNYSHAVSFFVLRSMKAQRKNLLRFFSESYGGGNDEGKLIDFIFSRMPKLTAYRRLLNGMEGADILMVSDFNWIGLDPKDSDLLMKARKRGMRIFSVGVALPDFLRCHVEDDKESDMQGFLSGYRFFRLSDFKFRFEDDRLKET